MCPPRPRLALPGVVRSGRSRGNPAPRGLRSRTRVGLVELHWVCVGQQADQPPTPPSVPPIFQLSQFIFPTPSAGIQVRGRWWDGDPPPGPAKLGLGGVSPMWGVLGAWPGFPGGRRPARSLSLQKGFMRRIKRPAA